MEVAQPDGDQDGMILVRVGRACVEVKPGFDRQAFSDVVRILRN
ncbi:MAG: hypothetical protein QXI12_06495 [Candidatus Methanomethyliaceae archaeon]